MFSFLYGSQISIDSAWLINYQKYDIIVKIL